MADTIKSIVCSDSFKQIFVNLLYSKKNIIQDIKKLLCDKQSNSQKIFNDIVETLRFSSTVPSPIRIYIENNPNFIKGVIEQIKNSQHCTNNSLVSDEQIKAVLNELVNKIVNKMCTKGANTTGTSTSNTTGGKRRYRKTKRHTKKARKTKRHTRK
jgi:hypothetical protein